MSFSNGSRIIKQFFSSRPHCSAQRCSGQGRDRKLFRIRLHELPQPGSSARRAVIQSLLLPLDAQQRHLLMAKYTCEHHGEDRIVWCCFLLNWTREEVRNAVQSLADNVSVSSLHVGVASCPWGRSDPSACRAVTLALA